MQLTYRNGYSADDPLFDMPVERQRQHVAAFMNLNPGTPEDWPIETIDRLLATRRHEGRRDFYRELGRMLSPSHQ